MRKFGFGLSTLIIGLLIQTIFDRYLSGLGIGPHLLLLIVVAQGFLLGPLFGETIGFFTGLMIDAMAVNFFGLRSLLFAFAGYVTGKLRRRVASERPTAQLVIGLLASAYTFFASTFVRNILVPGSGALEFWVVLAASLFNVLIVRLVFWASEQWLMLWKIEREHIE